jgi:hypothetical protein
MVFEDRDGDGLWSEGEPALVAVGVTLRGPRPLNGEVTTHTDAGGRYAFSDQQPGVYTVSIGLPAGYFIAAGPEREVVVKANARAEADFALRAYLRWYFPVTLR